MKKISQVQITICLLFSLLLLSGCHQVERMTAPAEAETRQGTEDDTMPEAQQGEPQDADIQDTDSASSNGLTVQDEVGICQYTVDAWAVYESWEDAGISSDELSSANYPVGEGGILLATVTQYCQWRDNSIPLDHMTVGNFQPLAQEQIDSAYVQDSMLMIAYEFPASYLDNTGLTGDNSQQSYFYYPVLNEGESATYTLGFVLSDTTRTAVENGSLFLSYMNGWASSTDDLLLLPVG